MPGLRTEGWELDPDRGRPGESWDRFDYHEEMYWRRKKVASSSPAPATKEPKKPFRCWHSESGVCMAVACDFGKKCELAPPATQETTT